MFERNYYIERFNADRGGRLAVPTLFLYLNDIMERNAESYGMGAAYHLEHRLAWVLVEYQININRWPSSGEYFRVGTLPYSFKRMYGYRIYSGKDAAHNTIMQGKGKFALINIDTKAFVRPTQDMLERFTDALREPTMLAFDKWDNKGGEPLYQVDTRVSHQGIDVNNHLNNAYYPYYAYQALKRDWVDNVTIYNIHVKFRQEAFEGDHLTLHVMQTMTGKRVDIYKADTLTAQVLFEATQKTD